LPLYAYRCTQCGHRFEKVQHFRSKPELVCPNCQGLLERPLTAPAFKFKGSGWYVNDYAGKNEASTSNDSIATPAPAAAPSVAAPAAAPAPVVAKG
jgi:putative FmdB family regulatory protein